MRIAIVDPSNMVVPYVDYLASSLAANGHEVSLWASRFRHQPVRPALSEQVEVFDYFYRLSSKLEMAGPVRRIAKTAEHVVNMRRVRKQLRNWQPDVIHFQQLPVPLIDSFLAGSITGVAPSFITLHNVVPLHDKKNLMSRRYPPLLRKFDSVVTHTEFGSSYASKIGFKHEAIFPIRPGLYDHYGKTASNEPPQDVQTFPDAAHRVLIFGNLRDYKGLNVGIEAFARLPDDVRNSTRLVIAGRGSKGALSALRKLTADLNIADRVDLRDSYIPDDAVHHYFSLADIVLAPHLEIDLSGILMVAIAEGKPIIASRVGSFAEYTTSGVHGILTAPGNTGEITLALEKLLRDVKDRQQKAQAMTQLAAEWPSWSDVACQHVSAYESTIST